jgi:LacI family transcriptional regulator/LacI family purine nucleotide synthesis repressor
MPPEVAEIAKICRISPMTVSRALRDGTPVSDVTRALVRQTAERMGYHVKANLGRPRRASNRPRTVVNVMLGTWFAPAVQYYMQLLLTIEQELARHDCDCVIRSCNGSYAQYLSLCQSLRASQAQTALVLGNFPAQQLHDLLRIVHRPILLDRVGDPRSTLTCEYVGFDNVEAARIAVRHLLEVGRRRVLLVSGNLRHYFPRDIERGYCEILQQNDLPARDELILETDFTADGACRHVRKAWESGVRFDAVFTNDEMAVGVLRALYELGLKVPNDVSVVGCDGLPIGLHTVPMLTTVVMDHRAMGSCAVERLFDSSLKSSALRTLLAPSLEIRESSVPSNRKD